MSEQTVVQTRSEVYEKIEDVLEGKVGERALVVKRHVRHSRKGVDQVVVASSTHEHWFVGMLTSELILSDPDNGAILLPADKHVWGECYWPYQEPDFSVASSPIRLNAFDDLGPIEKIIAPRLVYDENVRSAPTRSVEVVIGDSAIREFVKFKGDVFAKFLLAINIALHRARSA